MLTNVAHTSEKWEIIPLTPSMTPAAKLLAMRLNSLASVYYFIKVALRRHRLQDELHGLMASHIEAMHIKIGEEWPRDHFKSTIFSEGAPMWRSLPFTERDEAYMRFLGHGDEWINWMKYAHNRDARNLCVSSVIGNAIKLGKRIDHHYTNNDLFRTLFPEIVPDSSCSWSAQSMTHKRTKMSPNGEGTYDLLGVGAALQSRHYDGFVIEDDLVGRDKKADGSIEAIDSVQIQQAIDYHRILPGAFDSVEGHPDAETDEIIVGNRWGLNDFNAWVRENENWFRFTTHSALGGCCDEHKAGSPIFSKEFTKEKLERLAVRFGLYDFSCHYLNQPVNPGTVEFQEDWLRYYRLEKYSETDKRAVVRFDVKDGEVKKDVDVTYDLKIQMIVDPNHAQNKGRCRHAITVLGYYKKTDEVILLDSWAESCTYTKLVDKIYELADFWRLRSFYLEQVAAQVLLKLYFDLKNATVPENRRLRVDELKIDYSADAKKRRIRAMNVWYQSGRFWVRRGLLNGRDCEDFKIEYKSFPYGRTMDILDTVGYFPQVFGKSGTTNAVELRTFVRNQQMQNPMAQLSVAGY